MERSRRPTLWLLAAAGAVVVGLFIYGTARMGGPGVPGDRQTEVAGDSQMRLTDMEYTEVQEGREVWRLKAREAEYFDESKKTHLQGVHVELYLEDGRTVVLESREGELHAGTKDIQLWGDVRAVVPQGYNLRTERAFYRHATRQVVSDTPVHATGPLVELEGARWRYDALERKAYVDGGVRAVVKQVR